MKRFTYWLCIFSLFFLCHSAFSEYSIDKNQSDLEVIALLQSGQLFDQLSLLDIDPSVNELDGNGFFSRVFVGFEESKKQYYLLVETNNVMTLIPISSLRKIDTTSKRSLADLKRTVKADGIKIISYRLCGEEITRTCQLIDWILKEKLERNSIIPDE